MSRPASSVAGLCFIAWSSPCPMVKVRPAFYHGIMLKKSSVAHALIEAFTDLAEDLTVSRRRIYAKTAIPYQTYYEHKVWRDRKRVNDQLANLKRAGYLEDVKIGKKFGIALTDKGRRYAIVNCVRMRTMPLPISLRCYISFDIPESQRHLRADLRRMLRRLGFSKEHQSLWVSDQDYTEFFREFIRLAKADTWIKVFLGDPVPR